MYHSITFGNKNTWDDWHLVPRTRPVFNPPAQKQKTLDIPGGNGIIDLSESLTGYPVYDNRKGSFEFIVMNGYKAWYNAYSDIMDYIHGRKITAVLEDDPTHFYIGRFTVNEWKSEPNNSVIVIEYSVEPYKWSIHSSLDGWLWDTFNFTSGVISDSRFKDIPVSTSNVEHVFSGFGSAPVCPSFIVETTSGDGVFARFVNPRLGIDQAELLMDGTSQVSEFLLYGDSVTVYFRCPSGTGTVSIDFRQGRL